MESRNHLAGTLAKFVLGVYALFALFPIYWSINTALKPISLINTFPPTFLPTGATLDAFIFVLTSPKGQEPIVDSLIVTTGTTVLSVGMGVLAGYGFARFPDQTGGENVSFWLLSTRMFPPIAVILPVFFIWGGLGWDDSHLGLIVLYLTFNLPLTTWLMRDYFNNIPLSYEEAARVDGYSRFRAFYKVVLPLASPGIVAVTMLAWIFAWNEFLFAFMLSGSDVTPFPAVMPLFSRGNQVLWNRMMAMAIVVTVPPALILITLRERITTMMALGVAED